jgi:hypothetical protein
MKRKGVEPNVVTFTAVISACALACAKKVDNDENKGGAGTSKSESIICINKNYDLNECLVLY